MQIAYLSGDLEPQHGDDALVHDNFGEVTAGALEWIAERAPSVCSLTATARVRAIPPH